MHVEDSETKSVGEVSEACHDRHIRQELSEPSAVSSCGIRRRFEREESYHLGRRMMGSVARDMSAKATNRIEISSKWYVEIRNSHCLSALAEALVGNFQRAVAQQIIIERVRV